MEGKYFDGKKCNQFFFNDKVKTKHILNIAQT